MFWYLSCQWVPCWCDWGPHLAPSAHRGRALLGGGSPSPFYPSVAAHVRSARLFGWGPLLSLSIVGLPRLACSPGFFAPHPSSRFRPALLVVAPWPFSPVAGPVMALSLSDASDSTLSYSRHRCFPYLVVAPTALLKFLSGYLALPAPATVSTPSSGSSVLSRLSALSPPSIPCSLVPWAVGGFLSPPSRPQSSPLPIGSGTL